MSDSRTSSPVLSGSEEGHGSQLPHSSPATHPSLFQSTLASLVDARLDGFQVDLLSLLTDAPDEHVDIFMRSKSAQMNRFLIALFAASLHGEHPLRTGRGEHAAGMEDGPSHVTDDSVMASTETDPPEHVPTTSATGRFGSELASDLFGGDEKEEEGEEKDESRLRCEAGLVQEWTQLLKYGECGGSDLVLPLSRGAVKEEDTGGEDDSAVLMPSSSDIREERLREEREGLLLSVKAELVAPMMRIGGVFSLYKERMCFVPDARQADENNAEMGAEMLDCRSLVPPEHRSGSTTGASFVTAPSTSSRLLSVSRLMVGSEVATMSSTSIGGSVSAPVTSTGATASDPAEERVEADPTVEEAVGVAAADVKKSSLRRGRSVKETPSLQYWVCTTACSSFQHVGGSRYRVLSAHQSWDLRELTQIYLRKYRLRRVGIEMFFKEDDTCWMLQLFDHDVQKRVFRKIVSLRPPNLFSAAGSNLISMVVDKKMVASKSWMKPHEIVEKAKLTKKWTRREVTNFEYLMQLNIIAGRTFNDLTQYPVMPWVLQDFTSDKLNLKDPAVYRDLSKPIGALNEERLASFVERYESMMEDRDKTDTRDECNFLYGTHYSSIGVILYYLIRMEPFTTYAKRFQGGRFDHADRLFDSIADCWKGCLTNTSDVKELIPEFYYMPDFLVNSDELELGTKLDGTKVGDVGLPPWAQGDARKFVTTMRDALESEHVSLHLHEWIDLIFGYKQRLPQALDAHNLFHPHTYEGNVDLDSPELAADATARAAILAQIDSFGQTPSQLFTRPHEKRMGADEIVGSVFKSKDLRHYGTYDLMPSKLAVAYMYLRDSDKTLFAVSTDCTVSRHSFSPKSMKLEVMSSSSRGGSRLSSKGGVGGSMSAASFSSLFSPTKARAAASKKRDRARVGQGVCAMSAEIDVSKRSVCYAVSEELQLLFACGFDDGALCIWDLDKMAHVDRCLDRHGTSTSATGSGGSVISCLAVDHDVLVTGSFDASVKVWDLGGGVGKKKRRKKRGSAVSDDDSGGGDASDDGSGVSGAGDGVVAREPRFWFTNQIGKITCVDVSLKSGIIACSDDSGEINMYNSSTGDHIKKLMPFIAIAEVGSGSGDKKKKEKTEETDEKKEEGGEEDEEFYYSTGEINLVRVSQFGDVVCYSRDGAVLFSFTAKGELIKHRSTRSDKAYAMITSKSGRYVLCGGRSAVSFRDSRTLRIRTELKEATSAIRCVALDRDETYLFVGCANGEVLIYANSMSKIVGARLATLDTLGLI